MPIAIVRRRHWLSLFVAVVPLVLSWHCAPRPHLEARSVPATSSSRLATSASPSPSPSPSAGAPASSSASASATVMAASSLPPLPDPTVAMETGPEVARVSFLSAVIGPGRVGGAQWDHVGTVPDDVWKEVAKAMRAEDPYAAITAYLADGGFAGLGRPDVKGKVTLLGPSGDLYLELPEVDDSFTPRWSGIEFRKVPLDKHTRLRIEFVDANAAKDRDPVIGLAELDGAALQKIDAAGKIVAWPFADQTGNQVLFVMVSVVPE